MKFVHFSVALLSIALIAGGAAAAKPKTAAPAPAPVAATPQPIPAPTVDEKGWPLVQTAAKQAYLVDATTGAVLFDKNGGTAMPTSSMSKIMTAYLVFDAIKSGQLRMDQSLPVSEKAWRMEGSKMFVQIGTTVPVSELIQGVIVQSGNDACVVLAEAVAGSEDVFARRATEKAKELGAANTNFANATGLPNPTHYSTPRDLALLSWRLMNDFPEHFHYYSQKEYTYNNIKQGNRNPLLYSMNGADGMKTGHTEAGGYGLIGTAQRDGRRLIVVINGTDSMQARADESRRLLEWGYSQFRIVKVATPTQVLDSLPVWYGTSEKVDVAVAQPIALTLPYGISATAKLKSETPLAAPITKGQKVGDVIVSVPGQPDKAYPAIAASDVPALGFWGRVQKKLGL